MTMMGLRIFWSVFLASMLAYGFRRSWRIEHGQTQKLIGDTDEAVVWITPLIFPMIVVIIFLADFILGGVGEIKQFMRLAVDIFISMSVYFFFLMILLPVLRRYFSSRACATLWLLPVLLFYQPVTLADSAFVPLFTFYIPGNVLQVFGYIWMTFAAAIFTGEILFGLVFRRKLLKGAGPIEDKRILELWEEEKRAIRYSKSVRLMTSADITTPLSMGMFAKSQVTLLPERFYTMDELRLIFRHELHHIQRRDVDTKVFLSFCRAMCWFNPLVWIAIRKASDDLELSCDEIVLEDAGDQERRRYAQLLLHTAGSSRGFTTCLSAAAGSLRYRLKCVMQRRRRRAGILLLVVMMLICCMSYGSIAMASERGTVGDLLLSGTAAEDVYALSYYDNLKDEEDQGHTLHACSEELLAYIKGLEADKLFSSGRWSYEGGPVVDWEVAAEEGMLYLSLNETFLSVENSDTNQTSYYKLRSSVDTDYIRGFFE